jgi:hypothetical protein
MTTLTQLIHGEPGAGKSWFNQSSPPPRLTLDADLGSMYPWRSVEGEGVRQRMVKWDPARSEPPAVGEYKWDEAQGINVPCPGEGEWVTCNVDVLRYDNLTTAYSWLNAGQHPFRSVSIDSLTFAQKRCKDMVAGLSTLSDRDWGDLLLKMDHLVRYFCDLRSNPIKRVECITFLALTELKGGIRKPAIQGGLSVGLPGVVDLEGYLYAETQKNADNTIALNPDGTPVVVRKLLIAPVDPTYQAKDRTHVISKHYGPVIINPDITEMMAWKEYGETNG